MKDDDRKKRVIKIDVSNGPKPLSFLSLVCVIFKIFAYKFQIARTLIQPPPS